MSNNFFNLKKKGQNYLVDGNYGRKVNDVFIFSIGLLQLLTYVCDGLNIIVLMSNFSQNMT